MNQSKNYAIEVDNLRKVFQTPIGFWKRQYKSIVAIEDVSFAIQPGELFGLLGPNGAGKTTTIKILSTLLLPTDGRAKIMGLDVIKDVHAIRHKIGFTFGGGRGLYGRLSGIDNLRYFAVLYGLEPSLAKKRIYELLELMGLTGREEERVENYSNGMKQRLHLARVMLHDPEILFLDEPTVGIDPVGSRTLRHLVKELVNLGKTVLLTTHYMYEAEELCDRIAIIKQGKIVALDTIAGLKQRTQNDTVISIQAQNNNKNTSEVIQSLSQLVPIHMSRNQSEQNILIQTKEPEIVLQRVAPLLQQQSIKSFEVRRPTLEDVYVSIVEANHNA